MGDQDDLFTYKQRSAKQQTAFEAYHAQNPDIWAQVVKYTKELIEIAGRTYGSADMVLHHVRFMTLLRERGDRAYKINNNWSAFYARLWDKEYPEYAGFFRQRRSKADREEMLRRDQATKVGPDNAKPNGTRRRKSD